jgi:N-acetylglutamate synthase-like GNAT family acetyltransferase
MNIRRARADEAQALTALALAAKATWGYPHDQLAAWEPMLAVTAETVHNRPVFVGELDSRVIGFCSLIPGDADWELDNLWVDPSMMRRGYGRELFRHALATATSSGAKRILIDADPNAEAFYLACGAQRTGSIAAPIDGQPDRLRPQLMVTRRALSETSDGDLSGGLSNLQSESS